MLENFLRMEVFKRIVGDEFGRADTAASVLEKVEDADFLGRKDGNKPAEQRVEHLLAEMTLEEKVRFAGGYEQMAIQRIERLGLPTIWCSDATSGLRCFPGGTAFLAGVAMAASWDPDLIEGVGALIGEEFRATGVSILLGPGVNMYRVPTCGRNFEYMGEDPYLAGKISSAYIRGAQSSGVLTTVKHFVANNSDYDRHKTDSVVDERTLHEIYLPAFKMAVQEGGSWGVMNAYNPVNGTYASENATLLKTILREKWGFKGFVISDWNSLYSTVPAIKNGLNLEMPRDKWINYRTVTEAIESGELTEADIEDMIRPLMLALFKAGVYDRPQIDPKAKIDTPEHLAYAEKAAESAVVLLKNDGQLLPIDPAAGKRIVVMGRTAVKTTTGGGGSSYMHRPKSVDILGGVKAAFPETRVDHVPFRQDQLNAEEVEIIRGADVVILAAGFYAWEESECFDRAWVLPERQPELIQTVSAINPNTVVVLSVGGGVETERWVHHVPAVLHTFYLGEVVGAVVGRVLSGAVSPGGKLPFTMAKRWEDFEATKYYVDRPETVKLKHIRGGQGNPNRRKVWQMVYGEGLRVGYRNFDTAGIEPQFAFGHGLGYTSFELSDLSIEHGRDSVNLTLTVKNVGEQPGAEVVQVYVHDVEASVFRPEKELKAFRKVYLAPGESKQISLTLEAKAFAFYDIDRHDWWVEPGEFELLVGTSSREFAFRTKVKR